MLMLKGSKGDLVGMGTDQEKPLLGFANQGSPNPQAQNPSMSGIPESDMGALRAVPNTTQT